MPDLKDYGNLIQTAILADSTIGALPRLVVANTSINDDEDIEKQLKVIMGDNDNLINITNHRIEDSEPYSSGQKKLYSFQSDIYVAIRTQQNFDTDDNDTIPTMGTPAWGTNIETMAGYIRTALNYNKLTGDYLELGGEIITSEPAIDTRDGMFYIMLTHQGRLYE